MSFAAWKKKNASSASGKQADKEIATREPFAYAGKKSTRNSFREYVPPSSQVTSAAATASRKVLKPQEYKPVQDYEPLPDPSPVGTEAIETSSQRKPKSLFDGEYDEAANAREFQNALQEWRTGKPAPQVRKSKPAAARTSGGSQTGVQARGGKVLMARPAGQRMRCSTPEHEQGSVMYATLPEPQIGPEGPQPRQMAMLEQQQQYASYQPPTGAAGLNAGMIDEEANKKEFQAAMSDWRSRKGPIKIVYE